jgi:hypothetical protein
MKQFFAETPPPQSARFPSLIKEDQTTRQSNNPISVYANDTKYHFAQYGNPTQCQTFQSEVGILRQPLILALNKNATMKDTPRSDWLRDYQLMSGLDEYAYEQHVLKEYTAGEVVLAKIEKKGSGNAVPKFPHKLFGKTKNPLEPMVKLARRFQKPEWLNNYVTIIALDYWLLVNEWFYTYKGVAASHAKYLFMLLPSTMNMMGDTDRTSIAYEYHEEKRGGRLVEPWTDVYTEAKKHSLIDFVFRVLVGVLLAEQPLAAADDAADDDGEELKEEGKGDKEVETKMDKIRKRALKPFAAAIDWCQRKVFMQLNHFFTTRNYSEYQLDAPEVFLQEISLNIGASAERFPRNPRYLRVIIQPGSLPFGKEMPLIYTHVKMDPTKPMLDLAEGEFYRQIRDIYGSFCRRTVYQQLEGELRRHYFDVVDKKQKKTKTKKGSSNSSLEIQVTSTAASASAATANLDAPYMHYCFLLSVENKKNQKSASRAHYVRVRPLPKPVPERRPHWGPHFLDVTSLHRMLRIAHSCVLRLGIDDDAIKWMCDHAGQYIRWFTINERGDVVSREVRVDTTTVKMEDGPAASAGAHHYPLSTGLTALRELTRYEKLQARYLCAILNEKNMEKIVQDCASGQINLHAVYEALFLIAKNESSILWTVFELWVRGFRHGAHSVLTECKVPGYTPPLESGNTINVPAEWWTSGCDAKKNLLLHPNVLSAFLNCWTAEYKTYRQMRIETYRKLRWSDKQADIEAMFGEHWNGLDSIDKAAEVFLEHVLSPTHSLPILVKPYTIEFTNEQAGPMTKWHTLAGTIHEKEFLILLRNKFGGMQNALTQEFHRECVAFRCSSSCVGGGGGGGEQKERLDMTPALKLEVILNRLAQYLFLDRAIPFFEYVHVTCPLPGPRWDDGTYWKPNPDAYTAENDKFCTILRELEEMVKKDTVQQSLLDGTYGRSWRPYFHVGTLFLFCDILSTTAGSDKMDLQRRTALLDCVQREIQNQLRVVAPATSSPYANNVTAYGGGSRYPLLLAAPLPMSDLDDFSSSSSHSHADYDALENKRANKQQRIKTEPPTALPVDTVPEYTQTGRLKKRKPDRVRR